MEFKIKFMVLVGIVVSLNGACFADISANDPAELGQRLEQDVEVGLSVLSPEGSKVSVELGHLAIDEMDLRETTESARLPVDLIDYESEKADTAELVSPFISSALMTGPGSAGPKVYGLDSLKEEEGAGWKKMLSRISEPSSIGVVIGLGIGVVWIRRKLVR